MIKAHKIFFLFFFVYNFFEKSFLGVLFLLDAKRGKKRRRTLQHLLNEWSVNYFHVYNTKVFIGTALCYLVASPLCPCTRMQSVHYAALPHANKPLRTKDLFGEASACEYCKNGEKKKTPKHSLHYVVIEISSIM